MPLGSVSGSRAQAIVYRLQYQIITRKGFAS